MCFFHRDPNNRNQPTLQPALIPNVPLRCDASRFVQSPKEAFPSSEDVHEQTLAKRAGTTFVYIIFPLFLLDSSFTFRGRLSRFLSLHLTETSLRAVLVGETERQTTQYTTLDADDRLKIKLLFGALWGRRGAMSRTLALFLGLLACGLFLLASLPNAIEPGSRASSRHRLPTLLAYEGEAEVHTFFCDTHPSTCPSVAFTAASGWQGGIPGLRDLHLYSAHYDDRVMVHGGKNRHHVRMLGVVKSEDADATRLFCQFWYAELPRPIVVESERTEIWLQSWDGASTHPGQYYRPFVFSCPVPYNISHALPAGPRNASLVAEPCACPSNSLPLPVTNVPTDGKKRGIAVCVKGLDFADDISARLVEWLELQFLLGADRIFFYVFNVHPKVDLVLHYYRRFRNVQFEKLRLPGLDETNAPLRRRSYLANNTWQKRRHELIPYNDCYYRHIPTHHFVLLVDVDEVVVPRKRSSWIEALDEVVSDTPGVLATYASFAVPNAYFFERFEREPSWSWFLGRTTRSANFTRPGFAVKSFFTTNSSLAVFNHYTLVPLYTKIQRVALLSRDLIQLNHYREGCPREMDAQCRDDYFRYTVRDVTLRRFEAKLRRKVEEAKRGLKIKFLVQV